jgi:hypothetical protein
MYRYAIQGNGGIHDLSCHTFGSGLANGLLRNVSLLLRRIHRLMSGA